MRLRSRKPKLVVVTGAGSGIGRATSQEFARRGAFVVVSDIDVDSAKSTVAMIRGHGGRAEAYQLDVTDPDQWAEFADTVKADHGVADVIVNNAGLLVGGRFLDYTPADWDTQLSVNLMGVIHGCRVFGRQMVDRGQGGHIVNIASAAAFTPTPVFSAYSVSKAGVKMLSECLRLELGPHGIGVSAICPGVINTNIGNNSVVVGIDGELVDRGRELSARIQRFADALPFDLLSPSQVARAAVRATRHDFAVVPVRPEAWLGYFAMRVAPGLNRSVTRPFSIDRMQRVGERLFASMGGT